MGVVIIALAVVTGCVALFGVICAAIAISDGYGAWAWIVAAASVAALIASGPVGRQGGLMYSETRCDAIAGTNSALDVRHITLTYWDFGCYVDTGDAVIPWERYRAVIDG